MNFSVIPTHTFKKEVKRLIKKFPSIKQELSQLNNELERNPQAGIHLGNNVYKLRIAIKSKGKGKSGGARVISYCITENKEVYLLTIYDKSEMDSVDAKTIKSLIKQIQ